MCTHTFSANISFWSTFDDKTYCFLFFFQKVTSDGERHSPTFYLFNKTRKKIPVFQVTLEKKIGSIGRKNFFFFVFLFQIDVISKNSSYFLLCYKYIMYSNRAGYKSG